MMELPRYRQVPLGCGLATVLILLDPERNEDLKIFLNELYQSIAFLIPRLALKFDKTNEYKQQQYKMRHM